MQRSRAEVSSTVLRLEPLPLWLYPSDILHSVATGYGQPPGTIYDWALEPISLKNADYHLPDELKPRLRIEKFCDRVTKGLYSGRPEPAEFISTDKLMIVRILESEFREMESEFGQDISRRGHTSASRCILANKNLLRNQHDPSPGRRFAFAVFCLPQFQCKKY